MDTETLYPRFYIRVNQYKKLLCYQKSIMAIVHNKIHKLILELDPQLQCNDLLEFRDFAWDTRSTISKLTLDWNKYLRAGRTVERQKDLFRSELNAFHEVLNTNDRIIKAHIDKMADFTVRLSNNEYYNIRNPVHAKRYPNIPEFDPLQGIPEDNYYRTTPPAL